MTAAVILVTVLEVIIAGIMVLSIAIVIAFAKASVDMGAFLEGGVCNGNESTGEEVHRDDCSAGDGGV